jgi:hypothetical protein
VQASGIVVNCWRLGKLVRKIASSLLTPAWKETGMAEKTAYQEKYEAKLKEWKAKITQLEARAEQAKADAKIEYQEQIRALKEQEKKVRSQLEKIRQSGGETWKELKGGLEKAEDELKAALDKAASWFRGSSDR